MDRQEDAKPYRRRCLKVTRRARRLCTPKYNLSYQERFLLLNSVKHQTPQNECDHVVDAPDSLRNDAVAGSWGSRMLLWACGQGENQRFVAGAEKSEALSFEATRDKHMLKPCIAFAINQKDTQGYKTGEAAQQLQTRKKQQRPRNTAIRIKLMKL